MRITGGSARGIRIATGRASHVRPATDRMREAVFSSLGDRITGARILDLFAGSGSYGLEALSRGAESAIFVEKHPQAAVALEQNLGAVIKSMGAQGSRQNRVIRRDVLRFESAQSFNIIFMDPPYELARTHQQDLLDRCLTLLEPDGLVVYELPGDMEVPANQWACLRRIGKSGKNEPSVAILSAAGQ